MGVGSVRIYQRFPSSNLIIDNSNQLQLDPEKFNVLAGRSVQINSSFVIPNGQQLEIVTEEGLTIDTEFSMEVGSVFNARISQ